MKDRVIKVRHKKPEGKIKPYYYVLSWSNNHVIGTYNLHEAITYTKDESFMIDFPEWLDWQFALLIKEVNKNIKVSDLGMSLEDTKKVIEILGG